VTTLGYVGAFRRRHQVRQNCGVAGGGGRTEAIQGFPRFFQIVGQSNAQRCSKGSKEDCPTKMQLQCSWDGGNYRIGCPDCRALQSSGAMSRIEKMDIGAAVKA
jgi:hypothetical protein